MESDGPLHSPYVLVHLRNQDFLSATEELSTTVSMELNNFTYTQLNEVTI